MNDKGIFSSPTSPNSFGRTPSYALMIADDDGNIDQDFPEVSKKTNTAMMTIPQKKPRNLGGPSS
jgi:hypothetical protein